MQPRAEKEAEKERILKRSRLVTSNAKTFWRPRTMPWISENNYATHVSVLQLIVL